MTKCVILKWAQADLGDLAAEFFYQLRQHPDDNKHLMYVARQIKEKATEIEGECLRRIHSHRKDSLCQKSLKN